MQVWLMLTNLPLPTAIIVTSIGCAISMFSWYVFARTIQGLYAAQGSNAQVEKEDAPGLGTRL